MCRLISILNAAAARLRPLSALPSAAQQPRQLRLPHLQQGGRWGRDEGCIQRLPCTNLCTLPRQHATGSAGIATQHRQAVPPCTVLEGIQTTQRSAEHSVAQHSTAQHSTALRDVAGPAVLTCTDTLPLGARNTRRSRSRYATYTRPLPLQPGKVVGLMLQLKA